MNYFLIQLEIKHDGYSYNDFSLTMADKLEDAVRKADKLRNQYYKPEDFRKITIKTVKELDKAEYQVLKSHTILFTSI